VFLTFSVICFVLAGGAYAMRWTLANLFRLWGVRAPERTHSAMLWLMTIPATVGYFLWFGAEMARWGGN